MEIADDYSNSKYEVLDGFSNLLISYTFVFNAREEMTEPRLIQKDFSLYTL